MKKVIFILCAVCFVLSACSSAPKVTRVDAASQTDLSGRWNDSDVRIVCNALINSATNSPRIDSFIKEYSSKNKGKLPTVMIGNFRNISSEHIDTRIIVSLMSTAIINSGKLEFVASGKEREAIRAEREDQQYNASEKTAAALANETGANFMLFGEVNSMEEKVGNITQRVYFVKASMQNIETGGIIWQDENSEIKKIVKQPKAKL